MEPVEINAGRWYLRALRADERIDDRPALADLGASDGDCADEICVGEICVDEQYVEHSLAGWAADSSYSWAVCEPTTGELVAEVTLDPRTATVATRTRPGHDDAAATAAEAVRRFAAGMGFGTGSGNVDSPSLAPVL